MSKLKSVSVGVICVLGIVLVVVALVSALFHGYFDHGQFEVKETSWSSSARAAMIAKRSDRDALNGDDYFVLIGDHVFSPTELRFAYHSDNVVFAAASECLSVRWRDPYNLEVMCRDGSLDSDHINFRRDHAGDVTITYVNIPNKSSVAK